MTTPQPIETLTYEQAFSALQAVVEALENESQSLEQSLALYERGQALLRRCATLLEQAELRVRQLNGEAVPDED